MTEARSLLRSAARSILGPRPVPLIDQLARKDARWSTFVDAMEYVNYEQVPGDVVECGVFGGISLALLTRAAAFDAKGMSRRIVGIDSFAGLPLSAEPHARWREGDCATMHAPHPVVSVGEPVSSHVTRRLFTRCELPQPILHEGQFADVLPRIVSDELLAVSVLHVDCDLYESTRDVFAGLAPVLQDGTLVLFDDWFHYRGDPRKGEARAFHEFLVSHGEWQAVQWRTYGTFCNAFILVRR
jgi:hypothetical protein